MYEASKIDLIKAFMQFNGNIRLTHTTHNFNRDGGIQFSGHYMDGSKKPISVVLDKNQIELIMACGTIGELHECYIEMEYF